MSKPNHIKKFFLYLTFSVIFCFLASGKALAQTTLVVLEGVVTDEEGAALPGASVTVRSMETGYELNSITRSDGTYIISGIEPGRYEIEVNLPGFATQIRRGMTFNVGAKLKIDITLTVKTVEEEITVIAEAPMIEVTKSEISSVVDRQKIEDLPLLDRNFSDLTILKAGVLDGRSNAMPSGMDEMLIDGISNEGTIGGGARMAVPADAIQEFRILTNMYEAEYGNSAGMVRSAITRSGTNDFKGRLSFFYRDEMLDTPNYFVNHDGYKGEKIKDVELPDYKHNNFSAFIGGPIKKDKAHFFVAYEGLWKETYETITSPLVDKETINVPEKSHNMLVKFNYQLNEKNLFSFHYSLDRGTVDNLDVGGINTKTCASEEQWWGDDFRLSWTFFPSGNTMNEVRLLGSTDHYDYIPKYPGTYFEIRPSGRFGKPDNSPQSGWTKRLQILDHFSLFFGNHNIKLGVDYQYAPAGGNVSINMPGTLEFETDDPFNPDDPFTYPTVFSGMVGDKIFTIKHHQFSVFAQDSWRVTPRLTLNFGSRYFYYNVRGINFKKFHFPSSLNPRFAFSYDPVGDGKTAIRGGFGIYTSNLYGNASFMQVYLTLVKMRIILFPNYPDPDAPNPFWPMWEEMLGMPPGFLSQQDMMVGLGTYTSMENQVAPYSVQTTLGIQRELSEDLSLSVDGVWTKGYKMLLRENYNPIIVGTLIHADTTKGDIWAITDGGKSGYKALMLTLNKRYSHGWSLEVSYTLSWSKANTESRDRPHSYEEDNWERQYGYTNRDARHKLTASGIFNIPLGFQITGILYYRSKTPWNAVYGFDKNLDGLNSDYIDYRRNSRRGFDNFYINTRISKFINIDRFRFQVFGEVYNVFNKGNFYNVYSRENSPNFGGPSEARDPRLIQLGIRFDF